MSDSVKKILPALGHDLGYDPEVIALVQMHLEDAHNIGSNVLCETDKYLRLQEGGQVRSKYNGKGSTTVSLV